MTGILSISIGIGLAVAMVFSEFFGVAAGGMVVPGYFALYLPQPWHIATTIAAAILTYLSVQMLTPFIILYGRRRTVLMILVGYIVGMCFRYIFPGTLPGILPQFEVIGFIIPGLLAIWLDRQGIVQTLSTLVIVSVIVRLTLIIVLGEDLKI